MTERTWRDPIAAAWESIRAEPAPRLRRPHLRRLAAADRARRLRRRHRHAPAPASVPVHGRLGADPFRRAARARLAAPAARRSGRSAIGVGAGAPRTAAVVEIPAPPASRSRPRPAPGLYSVALEPRYRFENFVVGKANEVAFNAARTLATADKVAFNPLFLHGGTGRGKTHLLHAIGHEFHRLRPRAKIIYMSAEKFMVEFVAALRANETIQFKQQLRSADLLMIDDVQFIAGKESTQEEFFHTMNEIISAGRRLVISSDRAPQDLDGIEPRILSRLSWGLVADINAADLELRLNIITKKLEAAARRQGARGRGDVPRQADQLERPRARRRAQPDRRLCDDAEPGDRPRFRRRGARQHPARQPAPDLDRRDPDPGLRPLPDPQGRDDLARAAPARSPGRARSRCTCPSS